MRGELRCSGRVAVPIAPMARVMLLLLYNGDRDTTASLLAATLYHGNHDRNHKLWNIESMERSYASYAGAV